MTKEHIDNSIILTENGQSKLTDEALKVPGMAQVKNKRLLNNLCQIPNLNYLEVGLYKGSTFIASLFGNKSIASAIGIDNWSQFTDMTHILDGNDNPNLSIKDQFIANINRHLSPDQNIAVFDCDCFSFNINICKNINMFLYDGDHTFEAQYNAYKYFDASLANKFITVVDDWEAFAGGPRNGTFQAFKDLNYKILHQVELPQDHANYSNGYHNGVAVFLIEKINKL